MIGEKIKLLRTEKGITQIELAKRLHVTSGAVSQWEKNITRPDTDRLLDLAKEFNVSLSYFYDGSQPNLSENIHENSTKKYITIPVLGSIPAGIPFEAIEDILDYEDIPLTANMQENSYFGLKIKGDSMEPVYLDGDVIILRKQSTCDNGDDCAVMVNGDDATFKRIRIADNGITLQPLNPAYEPIFFSRKQILDLPVRIIGVVTEIRRKVRK